MYYLSKNRINANIYTVFATVLIEQTGRINEEAYSPKRTFL